MLDSMLVAEIRSMIDAKRLSLRAIARQVHVSRGTIRNMAHGLHYHERVLLERDQTPIPSGPLVRCPGCGGLVQLPCLLCRRRQSRRGRPGPRREPTEDLQLDLLNGDRHRYEAVRRRHIANLGDLGEPPA